jgi:hypothetical protein
MKFLLLIALLAGCLALGYWQYRSARHTARHWLDELERLQR